MRARFLLSIVKSLWLAFISSDDERCLSVHQELWHVVSMAVEVSDGTRQFCNGMSVLTVSKNVLVQLQRYNQIPTTPSQYPHNDIRVYGDFRIVSMLPIIDRKSVV